MHGIQWLYQGRNQVYGIRDHSPGIGIIDPGSRVTSHGIRISHFLCVSLRDQGSSFSDTSLLMKNQNTSFSKEKDLFSGLLKKLKPRFIIFLRFCHAISSFKAYLTRISWLTFSGLLKTRVWLGCSVSQAHKTWSHITLTRAFAVSAVSDPLRRARWASQGKEVENDGMKI